MLSNSWATAAASALLWISVPAVAQSSYGSQSNSSDSLPTVDLGYEIHQASSLNSTNYYFNNIRYAAPPLGENRFRAPQPPAVNRSEIQTGDQRRICPQASPAWQAIANDFVPEYLTGQTEFNQSSFNTSSSGSSSTPNPAETEDCLFLDVVVPQSILRRSGRGYGAPVLVWIYGGGYTAGSKSGSGDPAGLIARSQDNGDDGVIVSDDGQAELL